MFPIIRPFEQITPRMRVLGQGVWQFVQAVEQSAPVNPGLHAHLQSVPQPIKTPFVD